MRKGIVFIISSPSGVGKTTIANHIVQGDKDIERSVSFTTRKARGSEQNNIDYFFVDEVEFSRLRKENEMLEYAKVFTCYYGTSRRHVNNLIEQGVDVVCCIDWQGALQIKEKMDVVSIFLLPPSIKELRRRLSNRGTESLEVMNHRLEVARHELKQYQIYDYVIINDNLDKALHSIISIIHAERRKLTCNINCVSGHIEQLLFE